MTPGNLIRPLLTAVMDSMSRWSVGSSKIRTLDPSIIMREKQNTHFLTTGKDTHFLYAVISGKEHSAEEAADIGGVLDLGDTVSASPRSTRSVSKIAVLSFGK